MLHNASFRLVTVAILLSFQFLVIAIEILYLVSRSIEKQKYGLLEHLHIFCITWTKAGNGESRLSRHKSKIRQCIAPVIFGMLGIAIVAASFSQRNYAGLTANQCDTNLDADISGEGVRISVWVQVCVLMLISIMGVFHVYDTGIKEAGGGLILTHFSVAIALMVQMTRQSMTSVDAAIGAIILDAQNVALQIPLTAKETLAARWQVLLLIPTQIVGLVLLPVLVVRLTNGSFASDECTCFRVFWWSWLNDCSAAPSHNLTAFWIYYSLRWVMFLQATFHSLKNAQTFHEAEKSDRTHRSPEGDLDREAPLVKIENSTIPNGYIYDDYPATISLMFTLHGLFALTSMAVVEISIQDFQLKPSSQIYSAGQIIALIVAIATLIRAFWKFLCCFMEGKGSFPDLFFTTLPKCFARCCGARSKKSLFLRPCSLSCFPGCCSRGLRMPFSLKPFKRIFIAEKHPSWNSRSSGRRDSSPSVETLAPQVQSSVEATRTERIPMSGISNEQLRPNVLAPNDIELGGVIARPSLEISVEKAGSEQDQASQTYRYSTHEDAASLRARRHSHDSLYGPEPLPSSVSTTDPIHFVDVLHSASPPRRASQTSHSLRHEALQAPEPTEEGIHGVADLSRVEEHANSPAVSEPAKRTDEPETFDKPATSDSSQLVTRAEPYTEEDGDAPDRGPSSHKLNLVLAPKERRYYLVPSFDFKPDDDHFRLGDIIMDPSRPASRLSRLDGHKLQGRVKKTVKEAYISTRFHRPDLYDIIARSMQKNGHKVPAADDSISAAALETIEYSPDEGDTQEYSKIPTVRANLAGQKFRTKRLYIITGLKIARGLEISDQSAGPLSEVGLDVGGNISETAASVSAAGQPAMAGIGTKSSGKAFSLGDMIIAYQLTALERKGFLGNWRSMESEAKYFVE